MIDLSDGLSTDLAHLCEESGWGEIVEDAIPRARIGRNKLRAAAARAPRRGDYELQFTATREKRVPSRILGVPVTRIGESRGKNGLCS